LLFVVVVVVVVDDQGTRLSVWSDPLPLLHREVPPRAFMSVEPRSYPRQYSHLGGYKAPSAFIPLENYDHWNEKSSFPNLKLFSSTTTVAESSKSKDQSELTRRSTEDRSLQYQSQSQSGRGGYVNGFDPYDAYPPFPSSRQQRKWSDDDLENYFTQMRITTTGSSSSSSRGREIPKDMEHRHTTSTASNNTTNLIRPVPIRPGDIYRAYDKQPSSNDNNNNNGPSPTDSDESISGDSMATSTVNTFNSVNGGSVSSNVPEKNKVNLERIKRGLDHRTTIMVKNVPNKYTQVYLHSLSWCCSLSFWHAALSWDRGLMVANAYGVC
jgi:hypothetical protein